MKTLYDRLCYDFDTDLKRLLEMYLSCDEFDYNRNIREHFKLVADGGSEYLNHPAVLAVSLGGSTTKLMLASNNGGSLKVEHFAVTKNPTSPIHFYDYLDSLLQKDPVVAKYLKDTENPVFCMTLPVMIGEDNIPFHPIKIASVHGMLARNEQEKTPELKLENNLERYFKSRGLRIPHMYFQSDPVIAHLGGVSQLCTPPQGRSILLVCGTGMATADDNYQRVISRLPMMDFDEELYPHDITEGYVFESGCAGKGLYDVMARAIALREREPDSALAGACAGRFFESLYDSELVSLLWKEALGREPFQALNHIRTSLSAQAYAELQKISALILDRVIGSLAAALLVTAVKMNLREYPSQYCVIYEGSIAKDPDINPLIIEKLKYACSNKRLFASLGVVPPSFNFNTGELRQISFDSSIPENMKSKLDITLIGTAVAAMADNILAKK